MAAAPEINDGRKVYRADPSLEQSALTFAIFLLLVLLLVPFIGVFVEYRRTGDINNTWIGVMIVLGLLIAAAVARSLRRPPDRYLVLSPDGLQYQGRSRFITASWDAVLELHGGEDPALIVRADAPDAPKRKNATERISLVPFDFDTNSELAHDLRTYAPHLFERWSG